MDRKIPQSPAFAPEEACVLALRALFESRGYLRVPVPKFEDYALYLDNKKFLGTEHMLTFTDPGGRLLALKPDVTLSVVRGLPDRRSGGSEKLYYLDEVYRLAPDGHSYRVCGQVGVELVGERGDGFADLEVLDLALESLARMGECGTDGHRDKDLDAGTQRSDSATGGRANWVQAQPAANPAQAQPAALDVSHLGFVRGLLEQAGLPHETERRIISNIHQKNAHDVSALLTAAGVAEDLRERITALAGLHGPFAEALERARALVLGPQMEAAFEELARISQLLNGNGSRVNLDFSVVNDLDYYNALIFRGYLQGIPSVMITGGRYDNLMTRMGKSGGAVGFAIATDRLGEYLRGGERPRFDLLVTYGGGADWAGLLREVRALAGRGLRVRCEREDTDLDAAGYSWERRARYTGGKLEDA